jgi:sensor c-di-GMP phosphodiesterase-like protein
MSIDGFQPGTLPCPTCGSSVDQLKIDRTFVSELNTDSEDWPWSHRDQLGKTAPETVPGIRRDDAQALRQLGCDLGQGYHLAPPLDPEAVLPHFHRFLRLPRAA